MAVACSSGGLFFWLDHMQLLAVYTSRRLARRRGSKPFACYREQPIIYGWETAFYAQRVGAEAKALAKAVYNGLGLKALS